MISTQNVVRWDDVAVAHEDVNDVTANAQDAETESHRKIFSSLWERGLLVLAKRERSDLVGGEPIPGQDAPT